jgi:hypothetical protein
MELMTQVGTVVAGLIGLWALYGITVAAAGAARRRGEEAEDRHARAIYGQPGRD